MIFENDVEDAAWRRTTFLEFTERKREYKSRVLCVHTRLRLYQTLIQSRNFCTFRNGTYTLRIHGYHLWSTYTALEIYTDTQLCVCVWIQTIRTIRTVCTNSMWIYVYVFLVEILVAYTQWVRLHLVCVCVCGTRSCTAAHTIDITIFFRQIRRYTNWWCELSFFFLSFFWSFT